MSDQEDLHSFYLRKLLPVLEGYELRRRNLIKKCCVFGGGALFFLIPGGLFLAQSPLPAPAVICILGGAVSIVFLFAWFAVKNVFRNYKAEVILPLVKFIEPGLNYYPEQGICQGQFSGSRIFTEKIDRYHAEDLVCGTRGKTEVSFSEVHAEYKTTTHNSKGGSTTHWHTILKGVFFTADFNKHFSGVTVVLPDLAENMFGSLIGKSLQKMNISRPEALVQLEDPEFEKMFVVYSTDQIEARYILTPALMQRIMQLRAKYGKNLYFSFVGSRVNVAYGSSRNLFEPRIMSELRDYSLVEEYYNDLRNILGLVEELNLNNRIWTKK